jgi:phosphate/sulfate permease
MDLSGYLWIVVLAIIFALVMAFGIGANDVANAFASSVAAKSLTL